MKQQLSKRKRRKVECLLAQNIKEKDTGDQMTFLYPILALALCWLLTKYVIAYTKKRQILDIPNERSSHTIPTPRGGGLAIVMSFALVTVTASLVGGNLSQALTLILPSIGIAVLGWADDRMGLSAKIRLLVQLGLAGLCCFLIGLAKTAITPLDFLHPLVALVFFVLFITWFTNLYNFMDGIDGIAAIQSSSTCLFYGVLLHQSHPPLSLICLILAFASAGFLFWNWSPAKIFMGDVGSAFIGFQVSVIALYSAVSEEISLVTACIIHGSFIADSTYTLFVRLFRGQKVYQAHRSHTYQKAHQSGLTHSKITLSYLFLNLIWLFPLAFFSHMNPQIEMLLLGVAYAPLLYLAYRYKAGHD